MGESTPTYLARATEPLTVASRIDVTLPDVRLVAIVRQPVERMYSAMLHHIKRGRLSPRHGPVRHGPRRATGSWPSST